jgi:hypothetical protein
MNSTPVPPYFVNGLYVGFAVVILFVLLGSMFAGASSMVYATAAVAVCGAFALGYYLRRLEPQ